MTHALLRDLGQRNRAMAPWPVLMQLGHFLRVTLRGGIPGDVVELGCNRGYTSVWLSALVAGSGRELHVYDSFAGLPEKRTQDVAVGEGPEVEDNHRIAAGWFASPIEKFYQTFERTQQPLPIIHPGWFSDTLPERLPAQIAFAYLDGDLYTSILESLTAIYPRLSPGAAVVIDDYGDGPSDKLPGVRRACDHFFDDKPESLHRLPAGQQALLLKR